MRTVSIIRSAAVASLLAATAVTAAAQTIASRVAGVRNGTVRMTFAARPDICGHSNGFSTDKNFERGQTLTWEGRLSRDVEWDYACEHGPARLVLDVRDGSVTAIRAYVGGRWRAGASVTDLGEVSPSEAADYLLTLAEQSPASVGDKAIFPTTIANGVTVWPRLIRIARNENVPRQTRRQAVFWISQAAGEAATKGLDDLVLDNSVDRDVREQAVFALSQRPKAEGVPALIRVARTNRDPEIRKKAMFWLGQSNDPRAIELFEEILARK
ncbi:MAG: HEAT repeat domain-containing protein [Gemmatimonadaceae bacterium]|nr:HEAT repeat domain-containing protein [Gemmatimonadaceae bacterium]